ncbi:MAG TPA: hypothetical protein PKN56_10790 [Leptospiraceae bacterium]|nr:hypothetical protein [Leptospiraceae bacterium]HNH08331.1 hypothetical protein [Leptospiraceae bacterium]HNI98676.1 hypothetical protein [Leptospiraceae bacterium]HNN04038.1 hypothetical protein [Leptospiraceae bacterium]HNO26953.1 hypothetical protein [Leptospiraceae bacterium]
MILSLSFFLKGCYTEFLELPDQYAEISGKCAREKRKRRLCTLALFGSCVEDMKSKTAVSVSPGAVCAEMIFFIDGLCDRRSLECTP